ncbi:Ig-like domain-containing protein [Brevibacillus dissolubilis]|uniref:Ig-like domain-containing protein n=1 Tax=Brevibacillus dissolubilis TaxID=1844116 RepID=UPI00159BA861|nr:Ig-like domain-containing protein [Brevibacillus dissolubilis]
MSLIWNQGMGYADGSAAKAAVSSTAQPDASEVETKWEMSFATEAPDDLMSVQQTGDNEFVAIARSYLDTRFIKLDQNGKIQWEQIYTNKEQQGVYDVIPTKDNGYLLYGSARISGENGTDLYVIKTDSLGEKQWEQTYADQGNDSPSDALQTSDGGYLITGFGLVVKIDSKGTLQWKLRPPKALSSVVNIVPKPYNSYLLVAQGGMFTVNSKGKIISQALIPNTYDSHVLTMKNGKYLYVNFARFKEPGTMMLANELGEVEWKQVLKLTADYEADLVVPSADGNILIGQHHNNSVYDKSLPMRITKMDLTGTVLWEANVGKGHRFTCLLPLADDNFLTGGRYQGWDTEMDATLSAVHIEATPDPVEGVTLSQTSLQMKIKDKTQLIAVVMPSNALNKKVTWSSSNPKVVKVDQDGRIEALKEGTARITVKTVDKNKTAICEIRVRKLTKEETVTDVKIEALTPTSVKKGEIVRFRAIATFENGTTEDVTELANWFVSNSMLVKLEPGVFKAERIGGSGVSAFYGKHSLSAVPVKIETDQPLKELIISPSNLTLYKEDWGFLNLTAVYEDGTKAAVHGLADWKSSNPKIVTVDLGFLTGMAKGKAVITATYRGVSKQVQVTLIE